MSEHYAGEEIERAALFHGVIQGPKPKRVLTSSTSAFCVHTVQEKNNLENVDRTFFMPYLEVAHFISDYTYWLRTSHAAMPTCHKARKMWSNCVSPHLSKKEKDMYWDS